MHLKSGEQVNYFEIKMWDYLYIYNLVYRNHIYKRTKIHPPTIQTK